MKQFIIIVLLSFVSLTGWAHEPNEAYFVIKNSATTIKVEAEFPWTIRKALLQFDESLASATTKTTFNEAFFSYVKKNLVLLDATNKLKLLSIKELPRTGHSHGSRFLIVFQGNQFQSVQNELMFNLYENQQNHHEVTVKENVVNDYITTKNTPIFELTEINNKALIWGSIGVFLLIGIVVLIVRKAT